MDPLLISTLLPIVSNILKPKQPPVVEEKKDYTIYWIIGILIIFIITIILILTLKKDK